MLNFVFNLFVGLHHVKSIKFIKFFSVIAVATRNLLLRFVAQGYDAKDAAAGGDVYDCAQVVFGCT